MSTILDDEVCFERVIDQCDDLAQFTVEARW